MNTRGAAGAPTFGRTTLGPQRRAFFVPLGDSLPNMASAILPSTIGAEGIADLALSSRLLASLLSKALSAAPGAFECARLGILLCWNSRYLD